MSFSRAKADLSGSRFEDLRWVAETDSTNADVLAILASEAAARPGHPFEVVVVADHQRAGRGRLGRTWEAPRAASLLMTAGTTAEVQDSHRGLLLAAMSLAALDAIEACCGTSTLLKWPNDLVVRGVAGDGTDRKVAGVLAESVPLADGRTGYAVGIGINCNWASVEGDLAGIATSLDVVSGSTVDREELAVGVLEGFARRLALLEAPAESEVLVAQARSLSATLGSDVMATTADSQVVGRAVDLDSDGALLVDTGHGEVVRVVVGDVVSLRPR